MYVSYNDMNLQSLQSLHYPFSISIIAFTKRKYTGDNVKTSLLHQLTTLCILARGQLPLMVAVHVPRYEDF